MVQTYIVQRGWQLVSVFFFLWLPQLGLAQSNIATKYWVCFKDKHQTRFDPLAYFDFKAIARRQREGLSLMDSTDFPVNESYIAAIQAEASQYVGESRWLNASICYLSSQAAKRVKDLPFVSSIAPVGELPLAPCLHAVSGYDEKLLTAQTDILQYPLFAAQQLDGKNITIAIFDAGFKGTTNNPQLQHLIDHKQIKATYNFVTDRNFVFDYHSHGTMVLSCIAGQEKNTPLGCATGANFLLARTEQTTSESKIEEDNWVRSLEWADKNGADIVNSSLGYTHQLYLRNEMTGHTHLMAKAANTAFAKGILIVNSAGNEGQSWWEIVAGPADSDSILTVGGIDPKSGIHHPQSSYGPNASGVLKPNVSAFFSAIVAVGQKMQTADGTSFSAPLVTGFAACVWQLHPEWTVQQVFHEIQKSGHLYPYFDYAHGYGVPQASHFFEPAKEAEKQFDLVFHAQDSSYHFQLCEPVSNMRHFESEAQDTLRNFVYYHLCDEQGNMTVYHVLIPQEFHGAELEQSDCDDCLIRAHYRGQTIETTRKKIRQTPQK